MLRHSDLFFCLLEDFGDGRAKLLLLLFHKHLKSDSITVPFWLHKLNFINVDGFVLENNFVSGTNFEHKLIVSQ